MQPHKEGNPSQGKGTVQGSEAPVEGEEVELKVVWHSWLKAGAGEYEKRPQRREGGKSQKVLRSKLMKLNLTWNLGGTSGGFEVIRKNKPLMGWDDPGGLPGRSHP